MGLGFAYKNADLMILILEVDLGLAIAFCNLVNHGHWCLIASRVSMVPRNPYVCHHNTSAFELLMLY